MTSNDNTEPIVKRTFTAYLETIYGSIARSQIDRSGDVLGIPDDEEMGEEIVLNVIVEEYDEDGNYLGDKTYDAYNKDLDEVLAQVEADHDPSEWDNYDW